MRGLERRKVLFLEFNEITWSLVDPLIDRGLMPNLARMKKEGTWATPISNDLPPDLDPWVTWVTVHTGVDGSVHGAKVLEQPVETIKAKRTWEYAHEAGQSVGVFGSITSYPPHPVNGFWVPGPFAPGPETYPPELEPVQDLNRKYTRAHNRVEGQDSFLKMVAKGFRLLRAGLTVGTATRIASQLVKERVRRSTSWKRICLQPLVNFDFFAKQYRRYRPDYATWHTNHVAHFQHHYWRAMDDAPFLKKASQEEKQRFGKAVEYGYQVADRLLGRFMRLIDENTILILASSMGQKPYVVDRFPDGRIIVRMKDVRRILAIAGENNPGEVVPVMNPQWNVRIPDPAKRKRLAQALKTASRSVTNHQQVFAVDENEETLTISPLGVAKVEKGARIYFPDTRGADQDGYEFDDLFVADDPTPKEGVHDPQGLLVLWGKGIRSGVEIKDTTNIDIAPTVMTLLGIPVPPIMKGHVLTEAWESEAKEEVRQLCAVSPK